MTAETPDAPGNDTPGNAAAENAMPENEARPAADTPDAPTSEASAAIPEPPAPSAAETSDTSGNAPAETDAPENEAQAPPAVPAPPAPSAAETSDTSRNAPAETDAPENEAQAPPAVPELPAHLAVIADALGPDVEVTEQFGRIRATVPAERWVEALTAARDGLGADFLDWLTGVDELEAGYLVAAFVVATADRGPGRLGKARGLILRTRVAKDAEQRATLASATGVYRGAAWHERETFEMFGIDFTGHEGLKPLLLPDGFEGHPLRKDFVLAARVAKAWPGAKEPGESDHHVAASASPGRRRMLPPGVPGDEWLKPYRAPETGAGSTAAAGDEGAAE